MYVCMYVYGIHSTEYPWICSLSLLALALALALALVLADNSVISLVAVRPPPLSPLSFFPSPSPTFSFSLTLPYSSFTQSLVPLFPSDIPFHPVPGRLIATSQAQLVFGVCTARGSSCM